MWDNSLVCDTELALLSFAFPCSSFWLVPLFNVSLTRCTAISLFKTFSCTELTCTSATQRITIQPSMVSSPSLSSRALSVSSFIPQTIWSIYPSNHQIHILLACYISQSHMHQLTPRQVNFLKRMYAFQKLSSSSDYSTTQTSPLFYPLYSHHHHCPTETCCKLPRLLVPPPVTVSSLKPFHLYC